MKQLLHVINPRWHTLVIENEMIEFKTAALFQNVANKTITLEVNRAGLITIFPVSSYIEDNKQFRINIKKVF